MKELEDSSLSEEKTKELRARIAAARLANAKYEHEMSMAAVELQRPNKGSFF